MKEETINKIISDRAKQNGRKGGLATAKKLTKKQLKAKMAMMNIARWAKKSK